MYVILAACLFKIGERIYHIIQDARGNKNPCDRCAAGCELKRQLEEKQQQCGNKTVKKKKSCCG